MQPPYSRVGANGVYYNLKGLDKDGVPYINPATGLVTTFMNSGDPISNTGWLDYYYSPPCDVYFMPSSGPFTLAPLDTQRVVFAYIVGHGDSRLNSIVDLRRNANFVRDAFLAGFQVKALAEAETNFISDNQVELKLSAKISGGRQIATVKAELFSYDNNKIHSIELFDDGQHSDGTAGDGIFANIWRTTPIDDALYANLTVTDSEQDEYIFRYAAEYITLSDKLGDFSLIVVADNINYDGKANPGENVRLNLEFKNNYPFDLAVANIFLKSDYPLVNLERKHLFVYDLNSGAKGGLIYDLSDENSFVEMDIRKNAPANDTIIFDVSIYDDLHHKWNKQVSLKIEELEYVPQVIEPIHSAGYSDAYFKIKIINPAELTGHTYLITVSDSINQQREKGFNLFDQTAQVMLLTDSPVPDSFAYNIPITDGFKIVEAYLPDGELKEVRYENVSGGNSTGFEGVNFGGGFFGGGVMLGNASEKEFYYVELEFTNDIDSGGVKGTPSGQNAFRYLMGENSPSGFLPCPFNAWKIIKGQRAGKLNVCFQENTNFATYDNVWAPDYSTYGGFETLYIMKTEYDPTGSMYQGRKINMSEVLYKVNLRLISANSVVDKGDKIVFDWEYPVTSEDEFTFVTTSVNDDTKSDLSKSFMLYQNFPNPFNSTTMIRFLLNEPSHVELKIFNVLGQEIAVLVDKKLASGTYSVQWDGRNIFGQQVSSGVYFAKLKSKEKNRLIKLVLLQ